MSKLAVTSRSSSMEDPAVETAVPTLRVMRLQSPELHQTVAGCLLEGHSLLERSLCLPDSLLVYVGETFSAYLGILNSSPRLAIRRLTVNAQLQTPSQRWQLPSRLDSSNSSGGTDIEPESGVDTIVSHAIEEPGQHILRVEVGYMTAEGGSKTFRKFYRFQVTAPLTIRQSVLRSGDSCCFVSIDVQYNVAKTSSSSPMVISEANFVPVEGLSAEPIGSGGGGAAISAKTDSDNPKFSALDLYDRSGILSPGGSARYLFRVEATSKEAVLRGIGAGDLLGKGAFRWRKAMGETGQCFSSPVHCPSLDPSFLSSSGSGQYFTGPSSYVVHRSGLSVDVATAAARRIPLERNPLLAQLPVTVEPIDPPSRLKLNVPEEVQFLVVNHSEQPMTLQFQLRLNQMSGLVVCGPSFRSLGEIPPNGGSTVVEARLLSLAAGLVLVQGCVVVDLVSGREIPQPPLFYVFVEHATTKVTQ